jgi:Flp pilus assembly pilin Flp
MQLKSLSRAALRHSRSDSGQDLLEYALLVSLVVLVAIGAVDVLGTTINTSFWEIIAATEF